MPSQLDYLKCLSRTPGHKWDELSAPIRRRRADAWGNLVDWRCERCTSVKHVLTNYVGDNVTWYEYSKGYQNFKRSMELRGADLRLELISEMKRDYRENIKKKVNTTSKVVDIRSARR